MYRLAAATIALSSVLLATSLDAQEIMRRAVTPRELFFPVFPARLDSASEACLAAIPETMYRDVVATLTLEIESFERGDGRSAQVLAQVANRVQDVVANELRAAGRRRGDLLALPSSISWREGAGLFRLEYSNDGQFVLVPLGPPHASDFPSDAAQTLVAELFAGVREETPVTWGRPNTADTLRIDIELSLYQPAHRGSDFRKRIAIRSARAPVRRGWGVREVAMATERLSDEAPAGFRGIVKHSVLLDTTGTPVPDSTQLIEIAFTHLANESQVIDQMTRMARRSAQHSLYRPDMVGNCKLPMRVPVEWTVERSR